jgi:alcohol dehydrogenase (cytochrome c)
MAGGKATRRAATRPASVGVSLGVLALSLAGAAGLGAGALAQGGGAGDGASFAGQVEAAREVYAQSCASCHGEELTGGQFAGALKGPQFLGKWGGVPVAGLFAYIHSSMPPGNAGSLPDADYLALAALILHENGGASPGALASSPEALAAITLPGEAPITDAGEMGIGGISQRNPLPVRPARPDRFANFTPVTEAMVSAAGTWVTAIPRSTRSTVPT